MVSQENTPLSQPIPDGASLTSLFAEWKSERQVSYDDDVTDSELAEAGARLDDLAAAITALQPRTAAELAIQILVETDHGIEDFRHSFSEALVSLAAKGPTTANLSSRTINPTDLYQPKLDLDKCSYAELRKFSDFLWSISELVNAAIPEDAPREIRVFLDEYQAIASMVATRIAEQAFVDGPPTSDNEYERRNWSWLITRAQIQCAEGEIHLEVPGVPNLAGKGEAA